MITIQVDTKATLKHLNDLQKKRIPIATQRALLKTADAIKAAELAHMNQVFDRPTRWTLGAMKVSPVKNFTVKVGVLDPEGYYKRANYYLGTQITGGTRGMKAFEKALQRAGVMPAGWVAVPGEKAKLDAYGNMGPGEIRQIMSWFNAAEQTLGSTQNMTEATRAKRRRGTRTKRGFEYFAIRPNRGGKSIYLNPGVYRRTTFAFGKAIEPILIFVQRASYKRRFNFEYIAQKTYADQWPRQFALAFNRDVVSVG